MRVYMVKKLYASYSFGGDAIFVQAHACAVTVSFLLASTFGPVMHKRCLLRPALASMPLTALVVTCHAEGEFVGCLFGPDRALLHDRASSRD